MQTLNTSAARAATSELLSFRSELVDWQLGQLSRANALAADQLKAWTQGVELSEKLTRAWSQTLLDAFAPAQADDASAEA